MINHNFFKYITCMMVMLSIILPQGLTAKAAEAPSHTATSVLLMDADSDFVLYEHNADEKRYPASTTKIMTALLTLENANLDDMVTITDEAFSDVSDLKSPHNFKVGEEMSVRDILYTVMLGSANEMSNVLAIHVAGSLDEFYAMMNTRATEIGMTNTNYMNAHGLHDENHYTTASDLYKLTKVAMQDETFAEIVNTAQKKLEPTNMTENERTILTTNRLILRRSDPIYYDPIDGVKTGFTTPAGHCLVSQADLDGTTLISVVLQSEYNSDEGVAGSFSESKALLEWGFESFKTEELVAAGENITEAPILLSSERDTVVLATESSLSGIVPVDADLSQLEIVTTIDEDIRAPIEKGDKLGVLKVSYDGTYYGEVALVSVHEASLSQVLYYADILENFFQSTTFIFIVIAIILIIFLYLLIRILLRRAAKKRAIRRRSRSSSSNYRGGSRRSGSSRGNNNRRY